VTVRAGRIGLVLEEEVEECADIRLAVRELHAGRELARLRCR
jgi:hypothetical protein